MCNDNISSEIIKTGIINVQTIQLKEIIGDSLAKTLETLITNNVVVEPYKTLLDSYIQPYMQYAVLAEIVVPATYKIGNIGLNQPYTDNVNTTTKSECVYVKQYYTERAAFMENRLTTYLEANRAVFTDYQNYKDITVAKSTTTQAGLFLGGKTRGNSVDNTTPTFIHDNTIRAYIRYDEAQNLTPEQQAQVKLNIGIENINFDDIYTKDYIDSNYYNKQETDTAIQTAVDNVDVDLSEYYTKETVNNLLDNLPIPEYTSELVKDDVYTKTETYSKEEVDSLIDNVEVDLSNYYTKQETGTAIQTAIESIETFSGNYNDLTNKPDIYTKTEVDNLIDNIPLFSGDYNDLENKPTLFSGSYTDLTDKPQVYTKAEIDLQFAEINTTLGNINNILNTI